MKNVPTLPLHIRQICHSTKNNADKGCQGSPFELRGLCDDHRQDILSGGEYNLVVLKDSLSYLEHIGNILQGKLERRLVISWVPRILGLAQPSWNIGHASGEERWIDLSIDETTMRCNHKIGWFL